MVSNFSQLKLPTRDSMEKLTHPYSTIRTLRQSRLRVWLESLSCSQWLHLGPRNLECRGDAFVFLLPIPHLHSIEAVEGSWSWRAQAYNSRIPGRAAVSYWPFCCPGSCSWFQLGSYDGQQNGFVWTERGILRMGECWA
jgi:hypothetical protein